MFKIGDKVAMATDTSGAVPVGAKGVVQYIRDGVFNIVVDFGDTLPIHGSNRLGGSWCMKEEELAHDQA